MKTAAAFFAALLVCAICQVHGDYSVIEEGAWPKSWPVELEPLRKQSRTLEGPLGPRIHYEIPFTQREQFEAAWPHLLKVKSEGAPLVLVRGPHKWVGMPMAAGVRIHVPPAEADRKLDQDVPAAALRPGDAAKPKRREHTAHIVLVVDGKIVDLNRIPLPQDTPIIDERFKDED